MPATIFILLPTIAASDLYDSAHLRWDRLQLYRHGHGRPGRSHVLVCLRCLFANRASCIVGCQLAETLPMNGMPAGHFVRCASTREQILLTDGAIGHEFSSLAIVIVEE